MKHSILNTEIASYASNLNEDTLKQKIEGVFEQSNLSFVGQFTSQNEFQVYDKWTYIAWYVTNFKRKTAYLNGKIIKSENGSLINLTIKPNPIIAIFPIITIFIGIITILVAKLVNNSNKTMIFGLILVAVGILFYLLGLFLRNRLRNNFRKHLDVQKV